MLFLIEYDRSEGQIITFKTFLNEKRQMADDEVLEMELRLNKLGVKREVVILEAPTELELRRSHRRYFETLEQLATLPLSQ